MTDKEFERACNERTEEWLNGRTPSGHEADECQQVLNHAVECLALLYRAACEAISERFNEDEMTLIVNTFQVSQIPAAGMSGSSLAGALLEGHGVEVDKAYDLENSPSAEARLLLQTAKKVSHLDLLQGMALIDVVRQFWYGGREKPTFSEQMEAYGLRLSDGRQAEN